MIRYIHGSEDSLDVDVFYVFEIEPTFKEAQEFCACKEENRNIITVKDGIVDYCYKGTIDEINNGLFYTYGLHKQAYKLVIAKTVPRDSLIKAVRVLRCLISHCSRTNLRQEVKTILHSPSWKERIDFAKSIDYTSITDYSKNGSLEDVLKIFAFQIAQSHGLLNGGNEIYTKFEAATFYPKLRKYLYREMNSDRTDINDAINFYLTLIDLIDVEETNELCHFPIYGKTINLKTEEYIK